MTIQVNDGSNLMFKSIDAANKAARAWQANDAKALEYARAAVMFCLVHFAMNSEANKANAEPLSQWARSFSHRSKTANLGPKLIAWVKAVSPYTWSAPKDQVARFHLKKDAKVADGLNRKLLETFPSFDLFKAPAKEKPAFDLETVIKRAIAKAEKEGMAKEEIAKLVALFTTGAAPKAVLVRSSQGRNKAPKTQGATVTEAQQTEAQAEASQAPKIDAA